MNKYYIFINIILIYLPLLLGIVHCSLQRRRGIYYILFLYFSGFNLVLTGSLLGIVLIFFGQIFLGHVQWPYHEVFFWYGVVLLLAAMAYLFFITTKRHYYLFILCQCYALFLVLTGIGIVSFMYIDIRFPVHETVLLYAFTDFLIAIILYLLTSISRIKFLRHGGFKRV